MKRRVCESCLYFESAGFSKNGWCHHPARRANSDVRLMVRSNELNCRNGWNADLWVASSTESEANPSQQLDPIASRARAEIAPAQQNDLITSIVAAKTDNVALPEDRTTRPTMVRPSVEEDIFLKQTPSLSWSTGPISTQPATELVQNPKAAILRARDQFRQRRKHEGRIADQQVIPPSAPLLASAREARLVDDFDLAEPDPAPERIDPRYENRPLVRPIIPASVEDRHAVSPVRRLEIDRPFPTMTDFPEDRMRFESVPSLESAQDEAVYAATADDTWLETRQIDTVPPAPYEFDELFDEDERIEYAEAEPYEEEELSVQHRESILNRFLRQRRERQQAIDDVEYDDEPAYSDPIYQESSRVVAETSPQARARPELDGEPAAIEPPMHPSFLADRQMERPLPERSVVRRYQPEEIPIETTPRSPVETPAYTSPPASTHWNRREAEYTIEAKPLLETPIYHKSDPNRTIESSRASSRPQARYEPPRSVAPVPEVDDDFIIPPPLPEYQPRIQSEQQSPARPRVRTESTTPVRRSEGRMDVSRPPIADEFGDQPLFSAQPLPADDYQVDSQYSDSARAAYPAARMERICQTCRDFRPSDNGERGWCNNKWAFNHRRMVDADDLACRNSLGSWWTPKDDVWRRDGDISRHAQQTPRVDQWLFGSSSGDNDRRRSGS